MTRLEGALEVIDCLLIFMSLICSTRIGVLCTTCFVFDPFKSIFLRIDFCPFIIDDTRLFNLTLFDSVSDFSIFVLSPDASSATLSPLPLIAKLSADLMSFKAAGYFSWIKSYVCLFCSNSDNTSSGNFDGSLMYVGIVRRLETLMPSSSFSLIRSETSPHCRAILSSSISGICDVRDVIDLKLE